MTEDLQPQRGDFSTSEARATPNPVQGRVDAIVDDPTAGRVAVTQRGVLRDALGAAAVGSLTGNRRS